MKVSHRHLKLLIASCRYSNPRAVRVVHPLKYNQTLSNPCSEVNRATPCSHLCLTVPGGSRCKCPQGNSFLDGVRATCDARKLILTKLVALNP